MSRLAERIENFNRAYLIFSEAVSAYNKDKSVVLSHLALVEAYEVCYELAWKVLKDYLFLNGISAQLPREVIKEAFSANVIKDGQVWIDMLQDRNSTSHEYNMDKINLIIERIATTYNNELAKFNDWVSDINA